MAKTIIIPIIIVIVALAVATLYYNTISRKSINTTIPTTTTTPTSVKTTIPFIKLFLAKANASLLGITQLPYAASYTLKNGLSIGGARCGFPSYITWKIYQNPSTVKAVNYSTINKNVPFFVYEKIYVYNTVLTNLSSIPNACNNMTPYIKYAQPFNKTYLSGIGSNAVLQKLENLTSQGLKATNTPYIGKIPHISWYRIEFVYKHYYVVIGIWGFYKHMNATQLLNYANYTYFHLK